MTSGSRRDACWRQDRLPNLPLAEPYAQLELLRVIDRLQVLVDRDFTDTGSRTRLEQVRWLAIKY